MRGCLSTCGTFKCAQEPEERLPRFSTSSGTPPANLPPLGPLKHTPNQGPFPPHQFCCLVGANGTVDPSDTQRCFRLKAEVRAATPRSDGAPVLRHALCRRATPRTPVSDHMVIGRLLSRGPAVFPVFTAGRPSRHHFRGLLGLHTCCGPSTRRPTQGGPLSRELRQIGCPPRLLGSYWGAPTIPQAGLAPARTRRLFTARVKIQASVTPAPGRLTSYRPGEAREVMSVTVAAQLATTRARPTGVRAGSTARNNRRRRLTRSLPAIDSSIALGLA